MTDLRPSAPARKLSPGALATVLAIAAVLVLVSLPRLHAFALRENELDAAALTLRLGQGLMPAPSATVATAGLIEAVGLDPRRDDIEWVDAGRLLRHHGYLFELLPPDGDALVRAWPWTYGETGRAAFVFRAEGGVLGHDNADGAWTGPERPPAVETAGWVALGFAECESDAF